MNINIKLMREGAKAPARATDGSAAADLYACLDEAVTIDPGACRLVPTGIAIELGQPDIAAFVYARSSLGAKHGIAPANCVGVIDSDYRGEIFAALRNYSKTPYTIAPGERVAQLVIAPVIQADFVPSNELESTSRGAGGFGSTGKL